MEDLIDSMLDGRILLGEAIDEFEKLYIEKALNRNRDHISNTASALGIHRNTLSKKVADYNGSIKKSSATKRSTTKAKKASSTRKR
ncbi:MAG: hypothetical protein KF685_06660 [Acidobacteria bacterium]|nr:hypothetical protein [Acidobacteriota bacterium]